MLSLKQSYYPFLINSQRKLEQNEYSFRDLWHDIKKSDIYIDRYICIYICIKFTSQKENREPGVKHIKRYKNSN